MASSSRIISSYSDIASPGASAGERISYLSAIFWKSVSIARARLNIASASCSIVSNSTVIFPGVNFTFEGSASGATSSSSLRTRPLSFD